jgi:hypothetical protein
MQLLDILVKFKVKVFYLLFTGEQNIGLHEVVLPFLVGVDTLCRFKVFQRRFKVATSFSGGRGRIIWRENHKPWASN